MSFSEFGSWETFASFVNRAGWAWKNLLGQDKELMLRGGQIVFPATQNASTGANTLDDYEENTWTPAIAFGGGTTGITYSSRSAVYTKIGRLVVAQFVFILSSKGSSTGQASITGWPFTISNTDQASSAIAFFSMTSSLVSALLTTNSGTVYVHGMTAAATGYSILTDADFSDTSQLRGTFVHMAE